MDDMIITGLFHTLFNNNDRFLLVVKMFFKNAKIKILFILKKKKLNKHVFN